MLVLALAGTVSAVEPVIEVTPKLYQVSEDGVTPQATKVPSRLQYIYRGSDEEYKFSNPVARIALCMHFLPRSTFLYLG